MVLRLMLSVGFLDNMEREDEMDVEAGIFEEGMPLPARTECIGFFVDRLEVIHLNADVDVFVVAVCDACFCFVLFCFVSGSEKIDEKKATARVVRLFSCLLLKLDDEPEN